VKIISPHSEHYVSVNDGIVDFQLNTKQDIIKQKILIENQSKI